MLAILASFSAPVFSAIPQPSTPEIALDTYEPMPISAIVKIVIGDMQRRSYVLSPDILTDRRKVRISLRSLTIPEARSTLEDVLLSLGYRIRDAGSVSIVEKTSDTPEVVRERVLVYEPKHRPVRQLRDAVRGIVPVSRVLSSGTIRQPGSHQPAKSENGVSSRIETSTNDLLVMSIPSDSYGRVLDVLKRVDISRDVFTVRAAIVRILDSDSDSFSASLKSSNFSLLSGGLQSASGLVASLTVDSLKLALNASKSDASVRVVSMPSVRVSDGEQAKLSSGGRVPIKRAVIRDGIVSEEYSYEEVGARLTVSPEFYRASTKLSIQYQDDAVAGTLSEAPVFRSLDLSTTVDLEQDHAVLLGGLRSASSDRSSEDTIFGIPLSRSKASESSLVWVAVWLEKTSTADASSQKISLADLKSHPIDSDASTIEFNDVLEDCDAFYFDCEED